MLRLREDDADKPQDRQEEALTERQWQRVENTMRFIAKQQAKFEANYAHVDRRFEEADRRFARLERFADRAIRAGERRRARAEAEMAELRAESRALRAEFRSFLQALRCSAGNGRAKA